MSYKEIARDGSINASRIQHELLEVARAGALRGSGVLGQLAEEVRQIGELFENIRKTTEEAQPVQIFKLHDPKDAQRAAKAAQLYPVVATIIAITRLDVEGAVELAKQIVSEVDCSLLLEDPS